MPMVKLSIKSKLGLKLNL